MAKPINLPTKAPVNMYTIKLIIKLLVGIVMPKQCKIIQNMLNNIR
jgi:hypothetical protein